MNGKNVTVIGLQWGDEGKGKVVDALAGRSAYVARYCGGANAGHTVTVDGERFAVHLIPCGILHDGVMNVVGNGVAFDPATALDEIQALQARGVAISPENLAISLQAHVVMPWHKLQDQLSEQSLGNDKIGTTARGIGPCYSDKANRSSAIRVAELLNPTTLRMKARLVGAIKNKTFAALYNASPMNIDEIIDTYVDLAETLRPYARNTGELLRGAERDGKRILFEGGQGCMLDIDHGTYPFVTSSVVSACGVPAGAGVSPKAVGHVVGIMKAYTTRVGAGPFPTELKNDIGDAIRDAGNEYGTTTGRPRRCGWLDTAVVRYTADLSGVDELALMLLDVLSDLDELKICTAYQVDGKEVREADPTMLAKAECIYETLPGWKQDITGCRTFEELPAAARDYVNRVGELIGRPVGIVSVGPGREATIGHNSAIEGLI
ncbi:MAG: adenylosuccinate synthase [Planctomycetes bacterium]|jgi:adenylosuccinate synthase|nr:adenylosuccinate synthase [Planctomycetota bacterium]